MQPETEKQQKYLMRAMPVMFIFILYRFPAGLMLYWVTTNLWTIMQQIIIRRTAPKARAPSRVGAKPPGRFMRALTQAQMRTADGQEQRADGAAGRSARDGGTKSGTAKGSTRQGGGKSTAKGGATRQGTGKSGGDRPPQKRPSGSRPAGKGGTQSSGKRPSRPSGASDGPKRKPTS